MNPYDFLNYRFLGNTVSDYLLFAGILAIGLTLKKVFSSQVIRLLYILFKRYGKEVGLQKFLQLMNRPFEVLFSIVLVYFAFDILVFPPDWRLVSREQFGLRLVVSELFIVAIIISFTWIILRLVDFIALVFKSKAQKTASMYDDQLVLFIREAIKFVFVIIGFFVILGVVFNLDIVGLVAGLGIGGLAIALAAKESLENLLGSFTIFLDKPFTTGDSVRVGNVEGKVERVGFRSTRIRALDKMIVTVPNKKMIDVELINDTDRSTRRSVFTISLSYETSAENLKNILEDIRLLLRKHQLIEHGTEVVRFKNFGVSGLDIQVNFVVLSPDINDQLEVQEEINFGVMQIVKANHALFAVQAILKSDREKSSAVPSQFKLSS